MQNGPGHSGRTSERVNSTRHDWSGYNGAPSHVQYAVYTKQLFSMSPLDILPLFSMLFWIWMFLTFLRSSECSAGFAFHGPFIFYYRCIFYLLALSLTCQYREYQLSIELTKSQSTPSHKWSKHLLRKYIKSTACILLTYRHDVLHYPRNIYLESRIQGVHKWFHFTHVTLEQFQNHCSDDPVSLYMHEFTI